MTREAGFTLVELMVTVSVIAVLATISVPYLLVNLPTYRVNGAVRQLVADFRLARTRAVEAGVRCYVVFDTTNSEYVVALEADGVDGYTAGSDDDVKTVSIPDLYQGTVFYDHGAPGGPVTFPSDLASFTPRGTSSTGSVYLRPARDAGAPAPRQRKVIVMGTTGRVRTERWNASLGDWE
jgi:type IV fimbrial biogenesis protein FimT